ncbi:MAG TPA: UbiA family prenyltransferase, partial [Opitutaceae bacterium]|nr:UbiA family prenyltransferase [Opitutaceae bacterium]
MNAARQRSIALHWLDLARAGNFPSVASNVLAAFVLSAGANRFDPQLFVGALLAGALAYAGGATLNDVADASFDAQHRPERAIPRGAILRRTAAIVGAAQLLAGAAVLVALGA